MNFLPATSARHYVYNLLSRADINVNGSKPWDIQVKNPRLFDRVMVQGTLGLGESYMDGWWECEALDQFFYRIMRQKLYKTVSNRPVTVFKTIKAMVSNNQSRKRSVEVGREHYDKDNELFRLMLDRYMVYSCGYWQNSANLDEAQQAKLDLICRKLQLKPGMRLLDIGCGWGSLLRFAAENYGVEGVGVTISREQVELGRELCSGLPVQIHQRDYRDLDGTFDAVVSVGMFEHVGYKNYSTFIDVVSNCLSNSGLFLLHTIAGNKASRFCDPWFDKYIFPNGMLPSAGQLAAAAEKQFIIDDWHNFGTYYDRTLMAWYENFIKNWPKLKENYDEKFYRMWSYYLLSLAGCFRARYLQVWQVVFSPMGRHEGYASVRCRKCPA